MRVKVTLFLNGQVWSETVEAVDYKDAKEIALKRSSDKATIVSATAVY
tara:strand:- start:1096 stop:1239 length:144 start_codon:yes stop_codon:yes gene_type:complete